MAHDDKDTAGYTEQAPPDKFEKNAGYDDTLRRIARAQAATAVLSLHRTESAMLALLRDGGAQADNAARRS